MGFPLDAFRQSQLGFLLISGKRGRCAASGPPRDWDIASVDGCLLRLVPVGAAGAHLRSRRGEADEALRLLQHLLTIPAQCRKSLREASL
jgi:hypothetical protein